MPPEKWGISWPMRLFFVCPRFLGFFLTMELEYSNQALIFALILCALESDKELSQHMALKWVDCRHIVCQSKRQYCNQGRPCLPVCTSDGSGMTPAARSVRALLRYAAVQWSCLEPVPFSLRNGSWFAITIIEIKSYFSWSFFKSFRIIES